MRSLPLLTYARNIFATALSGNGDCGIASIAEADYDACNGAYAVGVPPRSEEMMFGKLGMVMVVVRDMERSVAFYRDVLGLKLLIKQDNWSQLDAGNIIIGLHPPGDEVKVSPTTGMSLGIYVDDLDKAVAEIRHRLGKIAVGPREEPFGRWALVFDPDGYSIQIIEMARGLRAQHKLSPEPAGK